VRRLNRKRSGSQRLSYASKYILAQQMLEELCPLLPQDFTVYVLFDSWYTAAKLITFIRRQGWHAICALKSNRVLKQPDLSGQSPVVKRQVRQWAQELRYTPYTCVRVKVKGINFAASEEMHTLNYLYETMVKAGCCRRFFGCLSPTRRRSAS
jgi:hypothetical protein